MSIDYKLNARVMSLFNNAPTFRKLEKTYFRHPRSDEIGKTLITYVKNPDGVGYRKEAEIKIPDNRLMARNDYLVGISPAGEKIYNEWTKPYSEVIKSYGQEAFNSITNEYQPFQQICPIRLLKLTPEIMELLGVTGDRLEIKVTWSPSPMIALVGDYLTENGYSISQVDVNLQYEELK